METLSSQTTVLDDLKTARETEREEGGGVGWGGRGGGWFNVCGGEGERWGEEGWFKVFQLLTIVEIRQINSGVCTRGLARHGSDDTMRLRLGHRWFQGPEYVCLATPHHSSFSRGDRQFRL